MKVEPFLTLVKSQDEPCTSPRRPPKASREVSTPGIKLLISKENQQARRLDPTSLTEARTLLLDVTQRLSETSKETLSEVHLLESPCLVRLP
jgi:hypothetical protein